MPNGFEIHSIAIHLVDKKNPGPDGAARHSPKEVVSRDYSPADWKSIQTFLAGHLSRAFQAAEGTRSMPARFDPGSDILRLYKALSARQAAPFFDHSKAMADLLFQKSPGNASKGLLLVLWFRTDDDPRPLLGLFKLDPGKRDQIVLESDLLVRLAVEHIDLALPESDEAVLKWALVPHPGRREGDPPFLKVRDEQRPGAELAIYFMNFLGCAQSPSARRQAQSVFEVLEAYGQTVHPKQNWRPRLGRLLKSLEPEKTVTPESLIEAVKATGVFTQLKEDVLATELASSDAVALQIDGKILGDVYLKYVLPSDITIRGPVGAMRSLVQVERVDGGYEFRLTAPSYKEKLE